MNADVCSPLLPNGMNGDCLVPLSEIQVPIITNKDIEFASMSEVLNVIKWKDLVRVDLSAYSPAAITSYEPTTDDPNIVTAESTGKKIITNTPIPSAMVYLDTNSCDYNEFINNVNGGVYGVIYALKGKKVILDNFEGQKYRPLLATVTAITKGIPLKDCFNNFPMYINHLDYDAFLTAKVISTGFNVVNELKKAMPSGANISIVTPYDIPTGIVRVSISERCSAEKIEGATVAEIEILNSNDLDTPAVTAVAAVVGNAGQYDLTLDKATVPVPMEAGDFMNIVYKSLTGTIVNKISNRLQILAE